MRRSIAMVLAVAILALIAVLVFGGLYRHSRDKQEMMELAKEMAASTEVTSVEVPDMPAPAVVVNDTEEAEPEPAPTAEVYNAANVDATVEANETIATATGEFTSANIDQVAYKEDVSAADTQALIDWLEGQPDVDATMVADFIAEFPEVWAGYAQDADGNYLIPLNDESLRAKDKERVNATVNLGLNKDPIDDAMAMPFNLNPDQVKKIKDSKSGVKIDFTDEELKNFRTELFRSWLENPILFEAYVRLICDQEIGDGSTVYDHYATGRKFLTTYDTARESGTGMNYWLRQNARTGQHYTTFEYQKYVVAFIGLFEDKQMVAIPLTAGRLDHYNLLWGEADLNSMRKATPANYADPYAALWFNIRIKDGRIGIRIGANFRDKRPEVIDYQATTKPVAKPAAKKTTPTVVPVVVPGTTTVVNVPVNPNPNPQPQPKPEYKYPTDGSASNGNAPIGGGKNNDPGPGTQKPDQGNGTGSYVPGTSENPDGGNPGNYDPGPAANATDNGTPPTTTPIVNNTNINDNHYSGGSTGGNNTGGVTPPPAED